MSLMCFKMIVYYSEMFSARDLSLGIADGLAQCAEQCVSILNRNHQYDFFKNLCLGASFRCVNSFIPKIVFKEARPEWFLYERSSRIDQALPSHQCCFWHNHWLVIFTPHFHFLSVKLLTNAGSISL